MDRKVSINEIRDFLAAALRQFDQGGIYVERVRIIRTEAGEIQDIHINYEERDEETDKPK